MAEETLSIKPMIAFGHMVQSQPEVNSDGAMSFTYRAIPIGLATADGPATRELLNQAGHRYHVHDLFPSGLLLPEPENRTAVLNEEGQRFFDSCPLYAVLKFQEPYIYWEQYAPSGSLVISYRGNDLDALTNQAGRAWPIQKWAQVLLDPWKEYFDVTREGYSLIMGAKINAIDDETYDKGFDSAEAMRYERVQPDGPYKVLYRSCAIEYVAHYQAHPPSPEFCLAECTMALMDADGRFTWRPHWAFRCEVPLALVGRIFEWLERTETGHIGKWSLKNVVPCDQSRLSIVNVQCADDLSWALTAFFFDEVKEEEKKTIEADLGEFYRSAAPKLPPA